jgi:hypothetical protein
VADVTIDGNPALVNEPLPIVQRGPPTVLIGIHDLQATMLVKAHYDNVTFDLEGM